jgi:hypothetical protein
VKRAKCAVVGLLLLLTPVVFWAQGIFATLTGVITDPSGAVIPNASVQLVDAASGSKRVTTTDSDGYYTFASVAVGTYNLVVESPGFRGSKTEGITLGGGIKQNVNVALQVGTAGQEVAVTATPDLAPVDSGEKSATLTTKELENFVQVGSNAAEFIKILPGFGIQNGAQNKANFSGQTIGINANGDAGSQSPLNNAFGYNGLPSNSLDIVSDGAHVSDPGCNCDTPVNPNSNFLQEFKVLTSNFSAETQKGPAVITSVTKAGGADFHGSGFFSARNFGLNANDAYFNATGAKRPENKYYYPGFSVGGPVLIPGTGFNRNRDKLFFYTGYEYFYQTLDTGLLTATVPTTGMLGGDFSPAELAKLGNVTASGKAPGAVNQSIFPGGIVPGSQIDANMLALMKLLPAPNADPNTTGGFNYVQALVFNQNSHQWVLRSDYNISDNTKLFVRYNMQRENQLFPVSLWSRRIDAVPYPTNVVGKNRSDAVSISLTHVFSPTMTNEAILAYTFIGFPNVFDDPSKVDRAKVGYTYTGIFNNGVSQIPSFGGNNAAGEAASLYNNGGYEIGGASAGLFANKYMPTVSDTLTKVWGTHTFKTGFFYEWIRNAQPASNNTNGYMQFVPTNNVTYTYGNAYADMLTGNISNYQETSFNRLNDISYNTYEGFIQDSWKATPRLTLDLGLRMTHFDPWTDRLGYGYSIFDSSKYADSSCAKAPTFCGFVWHARDSSVPVGGFPTRTLFWQPRFGFAYDLFGKGKTVIRGGWGQFYFHSAQFTSGLDASAGVSSVTVTPGNIGGRLFASNLSSLSVTATPSSPVATDSRNDRQPLVQSWSLTLDQGTPWSGQMEVAYVGNKSRELQVTSGALSNINLVPAGAMFGLANPALGNANSYRPYQGYGDINVATNGLYANYNALQVTWARRKGRYTMQVNYSFQKAMGIVSTTIDPFNLRNDYGVQPGNRTHLFNATYSVELGNPIQTNRFAKAVANGWQLSGIVQLQSGANLTYNSGTNGNFNMQLNNAIIPGTQGLVNPSGTNGVAINNQSIYGTNAKLLLPVLTCDPTKNLAEHQFINGSCFAAPTTPGQSTPLLPPMYGPAFFNTDLGLFKNFNLGENRKLQFRFQAYNFLNHPLWSFPTGTSLLTLQYQQAANGGPLTQTNSNFGKTLFKQGNRVVEMAVKFYF